MNHDLLSTRTSESTPLKQWLIKQGWDKYFSELYYHHQLSVYLDDENSFIVKYNEESKILGCIWEIAIANFFVNVSNKRNNHNLYLFPKDCLIKIINDYKEINPIKNINFPDFLIRINNINFFVEATHMQRKLISICKLVYEDGMKSKKCYQNLLSILDKSSDDKEIIHLISTTTFSFEYKEGCDPIKYTIKDWIKSCSYLHIEKDNLTNFDITKFETNYQELMSHEKIRQQFVNSKPTQVDFYNILFSWVSASVGAKLSPSGEERRAKLKNLRNYMAHSNTGYILAIGIDIPDDITGSPVNFRKISNQYFEDLTYNWVSGILVSKSWARRSPEYYLDGIVKTGISNDFVIFPNPNAKFKIPSDLFAD